MPTFYDGSHTFLQNKNHVVFLHNITNVSISEWNCYNVGNTITNAKVIGPGPRFEGSVGPEIPSRFQRL